MSETIRDYFDNWTTFEKVWLLVFTTAGFVLWNTWNGTIIGLAALLTGMVTVVLVAKGSIWNYPIGFVNVALYGWIAWQSQLYGEVMLNWGYFMVAQVVGLYLWKKNLGTGDIVEVKSFTNRQRLGVYAGSVLAIGGYGLFLQWLNGSLPFQDATSTVLSVIAMILMVARSKDQWVLWIVVDVVSIAIWVQTYLNTGQGINMITMWTAYLVNAVYGYWNWDKMEATA